MEPELDLSIIIPVFNEDENILSLAEEIGTVMRPAVWKWECLWVDDGSTDGTIDTLKGLNERDRSHHFIRLSFHQGQSAALHTGFIHARGKIFITLDGDGQNDPGDIPALVSRLIEEDLDMVNGWRQGREDSFVRKISSRIANGFRNWMTGDSVRDVGCSLRVFRRRCVTNVPSFKGMHRFLPTLVKIFGYNKIVEMPVGHRSRRHGRTKYGIHNRLWVGIVDTLAVRWMQWRMVCPEVSETTISREDR